MFGNLRSKLAVLILGLVFATTGAAIFAMLIFGRGALIEIADAQSRLAQGALLDEWEKTARAHTRLVAHSLVGPVSALDASAMVRIVALARNEPGVAYIYLLNRKGEVLADGTDMRQSVAKVLADPVTRRALNADDVIVQKTGETVEVSVPIRLGRARLGTVRIGYTPDRIFGTAALLKRQVRAAIDRAGETTIYSFVMIMAAAGIAVLAVGLFLARSFISPLGALVQASRSFGAGSLTTRVDLAPRNDEIGELAAAFDEMMGHIENHAAGMERLVEQRTRDLRESELRLRSIMDNADSVITLKDLDGRFLVVNRKFERRQGISQQEAVGKTIEDLYPEGNRALIDAYERQVIDTGEAVQGEFVALSGPEGAINLTTKFPVRNAAGELVAIGTINTDITELKRAQKILQAGRDELEARVAERTRELRDSEERYRRLVDVSPDGIMVHADGVVVFVNPTFVALLGADSANQIIGRDAIDLVPDDDRATVLERRRRANERTMLAPRETTYQRLDGSSVPVERAIARITWQGKPAFLVLARDITERNRRQEQLRQAQKM